MRLKHLPLVLVLSILLPALGWAQTVSAVHGIPGADLGLDPALPVDVRVFSLTGGAFDACAVPNLQFGDVAGPLNVPPDLYGVEISLADLMTPCAGDVVIAVPVSLNFGESSSIVAHLTTAGTIAATKFVNDVQSLEMDEARVVVRHAANAPAVDVVTASMSNPTPRRTFTNLTNPGEESAVVPAQNYVAAIAAAGTTNIVLGPVPLPLPGQTVTIVYAVGSLGTGTLTLITQTITL